MPADVKLSSLKTKSSGGLRVINITPIDFETDEYLMFMLYQL